MKLSVNNIYIVSIWVLVDRSFGKENIKNITKFVRNAIVYKSKNDEWYDLETGEKYQTSSRDLTKIGSLFINMNEDINPLTIEHEFEKNTLSKRKILKKIMNKRIDNK